MEKLTSEKKHIAVYTKNPYLFRKIELSLPSSCITEMISESKAQNDADFVFWDSDTVKKPECNAISVGRADGCDVSVPFTLDAIKRIIFADTSRLLIDEENRCAMLFSKKIKLTDVEFSLLSLLCEGGGEYVSREEILEKIWRGESDGGVINVYIHYLREKLEFNGEKVILSSRKLGYAIDKRFISGGRDA